MREGGVLLAEVLTGEVFKHMVAVVITSVVTIKPDETMQELKKKMFV